MLLEIMLKETLLVGESCIVKFWYAFNIHKLRFYCSYSDFFGVVAVRPGVAVEARKVLLDLLQAAFALSQELH